MQTLQSPASCQGFALLFFFFFISRTLILLTGTNVPASNSFLLSIPLPLELEEVLEERTLDSLL